MLTALSEHLKVLTRIIRYIISSEISSARMTDNFLRYKNTNK